MPGAAATATWEVPKEAHRQVWGKTARAIKDRCGLDYFEIPPRDDSSRTITARGAWATNLIISHRLSARVEDAHRAPTLALRISLRCGAPR